VYFVYSVLMGVTALLTAPYWLIQGMRRHKYLSNLSERLGFSLAALGNLPADQGGAIWVHAVSVGEVLAGVPLMKRLKERYPQRPLVVSATTLTGQSVAKQNAPFADAIFYFPFDWLFCVRRVLNAVNPALIIVLETEIWPNFLRESRRRNIPVIFASGRVSDRSFARYKKYLGIFGFYLRPLLAAVLENPAAFLMQTPSDADRICALGAPADRVKVCGNLKYDMVVPAPTPLSRWLAEECKRRQRWPVIIAGSIVATEEPLALIAFGVVQGDFRNALLVLAPRKTERFGPAADFIEESHRRFIRRSEVPIPGPAVTPKANASTNGIAEDVSVILLDSIGELASLYALADGAFIGGSLVEAGGHNILEPAAFGKVPVFGPSMENFAEIAGRFVQAGAAIQVESPEDAGVEWIHLLKDPEKMRRMGDTARRLVESSRGALERVMTEVAKQIGGVPQ
jgi:3-deoxy-D-manno-octulosonic-acid transferase